MWSSSSRVKVKQVGANRIRRIDYRESRDKRKPNTDFPVKLDKKRKLSDTPAITTLSSVSTAHVTPEPLDDDGWEDDHQPPIANTIDYVDYGTTAESAREYLAKDQSPQDSRSQSHYLSQWCNRRQLHIEATFQNEMVPNVSYICGMCHALNPTWKCGDCHLGELLCSRCMYKAHLSSPLHRAKRWNGFFFRDTPLWAVGIKLYLGHNGSPCASGGNIQPYQEIRDDVLASCNVSDDHSHESEQDGEEGFNEEESFEAIETNTIGGYPRAKDHLTNAEGFILVVHTNGVHELPLVRCQCTSSEEYDILYIKQNLFPATLSDTRTLFTFDLLRFFHLLNLEAKCSAYAYYRILQRMTHPVLPGSVPLRERELRRVMRQWRNLETYRTAGFAHTTEKPGKGDLAIYCATCPQPNINLPKNWEKDPDCPPIMRILAVDGNSKADHIRSRSTSGDFALTEGQMFMTEPTAYQNFLSAATANERKFRETPTCHSHKAARQASQKKANLDVTGIVAHACARHGCFAPSSAVDLQKGERQMNVDYSLSEALKTTNMGTVSALFLIYDVMCQYKVRLRDRFEDAVGYLTWPTNLKTFLTGIGKFHVHAHQDSCLYRYSPSYIPEAGMVDGEALEILWSVLNDASRTVRSASLQHRTEVLDDHMNDSNWKKMLNAAKSIVKRHKRACEQEQIAQENLDVIQDGCDVEKLKEWNTEILTAEKELTAGNEHAMDVMHSKIKKALSKLELELTLTRGERTSGGSGETSWLSLGLQIEETQYQIRASTKHPENLATTSQQLSLEQQRQRLQKKIDVYSEDARLYMGDLTEFHSDGESGLPEHLKLPFPSTIKSVDGVAFKRTVWKRLRQKEQTLREGQATDLLQRLRETISHLSFQYVGKVRSSDSTHQKTRAWRGVQDLHRQVDLLRGIYAHTRLALLRLAQFELINARFRELSDSDCDASAIIFDPNRRQLGDTGLSWIWGTLGGRNDNDEYLDEFYRLHFLRARATLHRWKEEKTLTKYEIRWTILFFMFKANQWNARRKDPRLSDGHHAYAAAQIALWNTLGHAAEELAHKSVDGHVIIWRETVL